jgi:hypothetical protein
VRGSANLQHELAELGAIFVALVGVAETHADLKAGATRQIKL